MLLAPKYPLWSGLRLPPVLYSHDVPLDLGSHQPLAGRFLDEIFTVPPLCLCMGQSLLENAFPPFHLAPRHSSFKIPLWEVLLFYQAYWVPLLWANTLYHHLSVTGLPRLDRDHWLLVCSHYYIGSSVRWGLGLARLWTPEPRGPGTEWMLPKSFNESKREWMGRSRLWSRENVPIYPVLCSV